MNFTKFGHACVRLEEDGRNLVIDPGGYTEAHAVDGASDILITHEHPDHYSEANLARAMDNNPGLQIWTTSSVAGMLAGKGGRVHTVGHGDAFTAAGFEVQVHGEMHAVIHPDIPRVKNVGFFIDHKLFHPGDALTVPDEPVETLLLPAHAPWSKISELIDYVREVKPRRIYAVHDGFLNDAGVGLVGALLGGQTSTDYTRLTPGDSARGLIDPN